MSDTKQLPAGAGALRTRLWDKQYRLIWDSATATTPAYQHVAATEVNATIDYPDGSRWSGLFYRTRVGVQRYTHDTEYLKYLLEWPEFES
jgi:hypothetical protein